jgi:hypothetical protein
LRSFLLEIATTLEVDFWCAIAVSSIEKNSLISALASISYLRSLNRLLVQLFGGESQHGWCSDSARRPTFLGSHLRTGSVVSKKGFLIWTVLYYECSINGRTQPCPSILARMLSMETGAMLNQSTQFIRIQIRNAGAIAIGCLIDGLVNMLGVSLRYLGLRERDYGPTGRRDRCLIVSGSPTGWLKRLQQQQHWHGQLTCWPLHWQLQQR